MAVDKWRTTTASSSALRCKKVNAKIFLLWCLIGVIGASVVCAWELHLDQGWTITNANGSIHLTNQTVPSGVYSALEEANVTQSVLFSYNDVALRWISQDTWTYSLEFNVDPNVLDTNYSSCMLVFHGLDTIANLQLNGQVLGPPFARNMFTRYRFNVCSLLKSHDPNKLTVQFVPPVLAANLEASKHETTPPECPPAPYNGECHMNFLRKMQASFAWDWGLAAPSVGIWKPVSLELYQSAIIRDVTYRLEENELDESWLVVVSVYFESGSDSIKGYLGMNLVNVTEDEPLRWYVDCSPASSGECLQTQSFWVTKDRVETWWPNGFGSQRLYELLVYWEGEVRDTDTNDIKKMPLEFISSMKTVRIGFRTIELVEDPAEYAENPGLTFFLRINHHPIFMKGSNWIPSHILPEKANNPMVIRNLLEAVRDSHMNMLRVWGGGIYESDEFYAIADELGILIWQDMMFACAMYPANVGFLRSVKEEIRQNIRRIQSHPSIALWAGNNENEAALRQNWYGTSSEFQRYSKEYVRLYDATIRKVVQQNDQWHIWLYSSPSNGQKRANISIIQDDPQDWHYGDIHYYNYLSDGWNPTIYPRPRFASEYGFQSIPSLNAWRSVLADSDNLTDLLDHRQHFPYGTTPVLNLIAKHLPLPGPESRRYAVALIYFSQISQAMTTRTETEVYRIGRGGQAETMGALYWQLNDVWVAPSWSSIEYNGNYKILHHWAREFFAPTAVIAHVNANRDVEVYVVCDTLLPPEPMQIQLDIFRWSSLDPMFTKTMNITMSPNSVKLFDKFNIEEHMVTPLSPANSVLRFQLIAANGSTVISKSHVFPVPLKNAVDIIRNTGIQLSIKRHVCTSDRSSVQLQLTVRSPTIFVYITLNHDQIPEYRLSKNGFMQLGAFEELTLSYENQGCVIPAVRNKHVKIQTVNSFMV